MVGKYESEFEFTGEKNTLPSSDEEYMINKRRSETIVKSNDLIEASYKLSLNEQRLILYMASKINRDDTEFRTVRVTVKEFADTFELDYKNIYQEIKKISKSLTSKSIYVKPQSQTKAKVKNSDYMYIAWLSSVYYRNGVLELEFSSKLEPYLLALKNNFSIYKVGDFVKFTSTYSIRLYQLLKRYEDFRDGTKYYSIEELRLIFGLEKKYPSYSNLKRRVLKTAIDEINEVSDVIIEMYEDKECKKVRGIQFKVRSKQEEVAPKQEEEPVDVNKDLVITVKTLLQTCITGVVQDKDAIALLKESKNDVSKIMQKIMLVQQSKTKIDNVIGFLIDSIRHDYQVIEMPPSSASKIDYIDNSMNDDFEAFAELSRNR